METNNQDLPCPFCKGTMRPLDQGGFMCDEKGIYISKRSIVESILELQEERRNASAKS